MAPRECIRFSQYLIAGWSDTGENIRLQNKLSTSETWGARRRQIPRPVAATTWEIPSRGIRGLDGTVSLSRVRAQRCDREKHPLRPEGERIEAFPSQGTADSTMG